jgi:hypothetical protein
VVVEVVDTAAAAHIALAALEAQGVVELVAV